MPLAAPTAVVKNASRIKIVRIVGEAGNRKNAQLDKKRYATIQVGWQGKE